MNKKVNTSVDGFVPRRPNRQQSGRLSGAKNAAKPNMDIISDRKPLRTAGNLDINSKESDEAIKQTDIDESLNNLTEIDEPAKKLTRKQRKLRKKLSKKPKTKFQKIRKWVIIGIIVIILGIAGYLLYKFISTSNNVLQGNVLDLIQSKSLKEDSNGRSNFLILGTSEDDPGHDGGSLTDSMLVVSISQTSKDIYMFSVPRDLYVEYGEACSSGYSGKINAYFACSNTGTTDADEQDRLTKTQKLVGDIFGMDIQYGIHVNHTVIKEVVDAIGGIDVDIEGSNGDSGVLDRNFDWRCNYTCYYVKYDNGVHHLDGLHALYLAQARGDVAPTYGLGNSNFDREVNQQKILVAIKDKATSTGVLTSLSSVTKILDSVGDNLRTNIQTDEIRTIMKVVSSVKSDNVKKLTLFDSDDPLVTTGNYYGSSVVMPSAGIYEYTDIQSYIKKNLSSNKVVKEDAPVVVLNGTGETGYGQTQADKLTDDGFNVVLVDNAPDGTYDKVEVYQIGTGNTATAEKLTSLYGITIKTTTPPISVDDDVKFVVIFGSTSS